MVGIDLSHATYSQHDCSKTKQKEYCEKKSICIKTKIHPITISKKRSFKKIQKAFKIFFYIFFITWIFKSTNIICITHSTAVLVRLDFCAFIEIISSKIVMTPGAVWRKTVGIWLYLWLNPQFYTTSPDSVVKVNIMATISSPIGEPFLEIKTVMVLLSHSCSCRFFRTFSCAIFFVYKWVVIPLFDSRCRYSPVYV